MPDPAPTRPPHAEVAALVRELLERLEREDVTELSISRGGLRVRVRRDDAARAPAVTVERASETPLPERESGPPAPSGAEAVKAPLSGVFYGSSSPQAAPYVQVGSAVSVGQVIGLIEAMKLFNEIRSTAAGRVARVLVETGQFVRAQTPLIEVERP